MRGDFTSAYKQLNTEQQLAVDWIDGPLLVIAGPGTGKTELLSLRVANILRLTDSLPENILCLTFSEAGAEEMQKRLESLLGESAHKLSISTYHGFGSEIIRHNLSALKGGLDLRPINELRIDAIIRELQKPLPYSNYLKSHQLVSDIRGLISDCKAALLSPEDIAKLVDANLEFSHSIAKTLIKLGPKIERVSFKKLDDFRGLITDWKPSKALPKSLQPISANWNDDLTNALEDCRLSGNAKALSKWKLKYLARDADRNFVVKGEELLERLKTFAELFSRYQETLETSGLYDYDDMIIMAIEALKSSPELRYNLQERYLYVLLDEYQDTNLAQAELVNLLANNPVNEGRPNIMAVGDDDQAIYSFQGAKHSNMLDFITTYPKAKIISLKTNYRSIAPIIDLSTSVASSISERLVDSLKGTTKDFRAANRSAGSITSIEVSNELEQFAFVTKALASNSKGEVAIIAPRHHILETAAAFLQAAKIPLRYERKENILDNPLVDQLVTMARLTLALTQDESGHNTDHLLGLVLNFDFWELPTVTVIKTSWTAHDKRRPWLKVMLAQKPTEAIALALIKLAADSQVQRFDVVIDELLGLSDITIRTKSFKRLRIPFYDFYKSDQSKIIRLFSDLMTLRQQFKEFNNLDNRPLMLSDFVDFIDQLKLSDTRLSNDFTFEEPESKVTLLTAHGSKGQEFDKVYLLSAVDEVWGPKARSRRDKLSLPPNLSYIRHTAEDSDDEKRRLLYVALSRARSEVKLISYTQNNNGRPTTSLTYLTDSRLPQPTKPHLKLEAQTVATYWQSSVKPLELAGDLKAALKPRLNHYSLSASDLNTFIDVRHLGPQKFYEKAILKYVEATNPRTDYGTAIHKALEWLQTDYLAKGRPPTLAQLLKRFEQALIKRRLLKQDFEILLADGRAALSVYYQKNKTKLSADDLSEFSFRREGVLLGPARLSGKIDKLIINKTKREIEVVDYKSSRGYDRPRPIPRLHIYENQLYFYKLLVENSVTFAGYKVDHGLLDFIEPSNGQLKPLAVEFNDQRLQRFKHLVAAVWQHIMELNFPDISGYSADLKGIEAFEDDLINGRI